MNFNLASSLYGVIAALTWGAGDFSGGIATKRSSAHSVVMVAHLASLLLLLAIAVIIREPLPSRDEWLWGGAAGLGGGFGLMMLYSALASGNMALAAPVSALVAAALPVILTAISGGTPDTFVLTGFFFALLAIWFLSSGSVAIFKVSDIQLPIGAGLAFGFFFICLHKASTIAILYPLIAVRIVSISSLFLFAKLKGHPITPNRHSLLPIFMSGVLDTLGNGAFALAAQTGRVDVAAVLSSLYPGSTVLLAWILLKEHITYKQVVGIVFALVGIILITI